MFTGWASACTVSGNVLTVGGVLGNPSSFIQFSVGMILYGRGLDLPAWGSDPNVAGTGVTIIGDHSTDGTLTGVGYAGTYRLSRSGYSITTPVPVISMYQGSLSGCTITSLQTEACHHSVYINSVSACNIAGAGFGSGPEECVNQFGQKGLCPRAPLYLRGASATKISGCASACSTSQLGGVYIDNVGQSTNAVSFDSCTSQKAADNTVTASIKNAAGTGAGDILNVTVFSSGLALGVGMLVTGSGVTAGTTIIANSSIDATLTGYIGTGTYRVNNSQNVSSETMTVVTGNDWVLPTNVETLTGLQIVNCSGNGTGLNSLGMTFASLPGEVTSNTHIQRMEGAKYSIVDGQKTGPATALMGDIVIGGGSQHIEVRWNGTSWTRSG
jgi:hypothetical protein